MITAFVSEYFGGLQNGLGAGSRRAIVEHEIRRGWAYVLAACILGLTFFVARTGLEQIVDRPRTGATTIAPGADKGAEGTGGARVARGARSGMALRRSWPWLDAVGRRRAAGADSDATAATATTAASSSSGRATTVKLQLQWFTQAQFAGYFAAVDQGFYEARVSTSRSSKAVSTSCRRRCSPTAQVDFALAWVPKALASREAGADIVNVGQVFQRSGTLQVSFKDEEHHQGRPTSRARSRQLGLRQRVRGLRRDDQGGSRPGEGRHQRAAAVRHEGLLAGEIDAAEAMTYNEYAQVLEAKNPKTGQLYTAGRPQRHRLQQRRRRHAAGRHLGQRRAARTTAYQDTTTKFLTASFEGWIYCRDNAEECPDIVVAKGSKLGKSHQLWQMNEINKLIWPSDQGHRHLDKAAWDQTVKIAQSTKNLEGKTVLTASRPRGRTRTTSCRAPPSCSVPRSTTTVPTTAIPIEDALPARGEGPDHLIPRRLNRKCRDKPDNSVRCCPISSVRLGLPGAGPGDDRIGWMARRAIAFSALAAMNWRRRPAGPACRTRRRPRTARVCARRARSAG